MPNKIIAFPFSEITNNQTINPTDLFEVENILEFQEICGKIKDEKGVVDFVMYMKNKDILKNHNYSITESTRNGKTVYRTYVNDPTKKSGRRQIESTTRENLDKKIIIHYNLSAKPKGHNFEEVYKDWLFEYKESEVSGATVQRINSDYIRFYMSDEISKKNVEELTTIYCKNFLNKQIKKHGLTRKALNNMKTILNNVIWYSIEKKYITENPLRDMKIQSTFIQPEKKKADEEEVFNYEEIELVQKTILEEIETEKDTAAYAILLSFQLGVRVGELITLKWSDIDENSVHIQRMVRTYRKVDRETLKPIGKQIYEVLPNTKTPAGNRNIFLTDKARSYLDEIKRLNKERGFSNEYIFYQENGNRMNRQRVNTVLYSYCDKVNITKKSSHKIRKTFISNLIENGFNPEVITKMVGHEDYQTTLKSYCRSLKKRKQLENELNECCL